MIEVAVLPVEKFFNHMPRLQLNTCHINIMSIMNLYSTES